MKILVAVYALVLLSQTEGQESSLNIHLDQPGHKISPVLWGIFFEEISHAGDGGLYAELIKNRGLSQKFAPTLDGYSVVKSGSAVGEISLSSSDPLNSVLQTSLRLGIDEALSPGDRIGISNSGFWGIPIRPDYPTYRASFYAKGDSFTGPLTVSIESNNETIVYASAVIPAITTEFQKYEVILQPPSNLIQIPSLDNKFVISANGPIAAGASIIFNVVSLFPPTWKNRTNGLRIDLAEKLLDAKPSFIRFPGGNFLEGNRYEERFIWEETLGDVSERQGFPGCWGYYSSNGLGLMEYLLLAEDLNAEIVLGIYAGYSLNGDTVPPEEMGPHIESALNEIEYIIGNTSTTWGARRAADGHPEPFPLTYVEIGNEDFFTSDYEIRYPLYYDAITKRYPEIVIIATHKVESRPVPILDEHIYPGFGWFPDNNDHYDSYPRNGSKIFLGEYATRDDVNTHAEEKANTKAALDDAAFMAGMERNSDIVVMACYTPLFCNINDLYGNFYEGFGAIYYNGIQSYATPMWWVQHLFSVFTADTHIPSDSNANVRTFFHVVSLNTTSNNLIIKLINTDSEDMLIDTVQLVGVSNNGTKAGILTMLTGGEWDINDFDDPLKVSPKTSAFNITGNSFSFNSPAFSMAILELKLD